MRTNHIDQLLEAIKDGTLTIRHKDGSQWQLDPADKQTICSGLEKQIPKKAYALEDETYGVMRICPNCSWRVIHDTSTYCLNCGQAIDWKEE